MLQESLNARIDKKSISSLSPTKPPGQPQHSSKQYDRRPFNDNPRSSSPSRLRSKTFSTDPKINNNDHMMSQNKQKVQNRYNSSVSGNMAANDFRSRKLGVINAACSRMLNNLMGRNSMPPDLPTNYESCSPSTSSIIESSNSPAFSFSSRSSNQECQVLDDQMPSCLSSPNSPTLVTSKPENLSFRKVFKKRSV